MSSCVNNSSSAGGICRSHSEYVEMIWLSILIAIGVPLNLYSLFEQKLHRSTARQSQSHVCVTRFELLKQNLTVANLMVLCFYAMGSLIWLATVVFHAPGFICRLLQFLYMFVANLSSNLICVIALDRALTSRGDVVVKTQALVRARIMLAVAWTVAAVAAFPQLFLWTTGDYMDSQQCVSVWAIRRRDENSSTEYKDEQTYQYYHLIMVFWAPATVTISCYTVLCRRLFVHLRRHTDRLSSIANPSLPPSQPSPPVVAPAVQDEPASDTALTVLSMSRSASAVAMPKRPVDNRVPRRCSDQPPTPLREQSSPVTQSRRTPRNSNRSTGTRGSVAAMLRHPLLTRGTSSRDLVRRAIVSTFTQTVMLLTAYIALWLPYNILSVLGIFLDKDDAYKILDQFSFLYSLQILNAVINPILYRVGSDPGACTMRCVVRENRQTMPVTRL